MCYSARVKQNLDELSQRYKAEVDWAMFEDLYRRKAEGEDVKTAAALERNFLHPRTDIQARTKASIDAYRAEKTASWEMEIFTQKRRQTEAQESLNLKITKRAQEDLRISTKKIQTLLARLADLRRSELEEKDERIFPLTYVPLLIQENGRTVIKPMRYACRLAGKPANYDQRFPGTYNARRDNLTGFWNGVYGRKHGVMVISGFFENVPLHLYEQRELRPGEAAQNLVLHFNPHPSDDMLIACLWDHWTGAGSDLYSFAAVTDEPPQEIAATGHQRCVIALREENMQQWLAPASLSHERLEAILSDKETPYYEHRIAA